MPLRRVEWKFHQRRDFIDPQVTHSEAVGSVWLSEANARQFVSLSRKLNLNVLPALFALLVADASVFERATG